MNSIEARVLLSTLKTRVKDPQYCRKKNLQKDILHLFAFNPTENRIFLKPKGFISDAKHNPQILDTFTKAIGTLESDKSFFRKKFYFDLRQEFKQAERLKEPHEGAIVVYNPEIAELFQKKTDKLQQIEANFISHSPLHSLPAQSQPTLDSKSFQNIFDDNFIMNPESRDYFLEYLRLHPDYASTEGFAKLTDISEALKTDQSLIQEFYKANKVLSQKNRWKLIQAKSKTMAEAIHNLKPGEKSFFTGSVGTEMNSITSVLTFLSKLPDFSQYGSLKLQDLSKRQNADPLSILAPIIEKQLDHFIKSLPLLNDPSPALTQLINFVTSGPQQSYIQSLGVDLTGLQSVEQRQQLVQHYKELLMGYVNRELDSPRTMINSFISSLGSSIQDLFPTQLLHATSLDGYISYAPVWFEFECRDNGKINITIYGSGMALQQHEDDSPDGKIVWPLKLLNVDPSDLDEIFFQRLLFHRIEPNLNSDALSTASDLYDNVFASIKKYDKPKSRDWREVDTTVNNHARLLETLLINKDVNRTKVLFEMRFEALLNYCRPYISENGLGGFSDSAFYQLSVVVPILEGMHQRLTSRFNSDKNRNIQLVFDEIKYFLHKHENSKITKKEKPVLPEAVLRPIQTWALQAGLSAESVDYIQQYLCQSIGDQIEPISLYIAQILKEALALPRIQDSVQTNLEPTPTLPSALDNIKHAFNNLNSMYGLAIAMASSQFGHLLPEPILNSLQNAQNQFNQNLFSTVFSAFLAAGALPPLDSLERIGNSLNNIEKIALHVESPPPKGTLDNLFPPSNMMTSSYDTTNPGGNDYLDYAIARRPPVNTTEALLNEINELGSLNSLHIGQTVYVCHVVLSWEFPEVHQKTLWSSVSNPEQCIAQLANLNMLLPYEKNVALYFNFAAAKYKILTIMHYLVVHVLKQEACNHPLNIIPLIRNIKNAPSLMTDPEIIHELQKIISYQFPQLDIENLPSVEALKKLEENSLFFLSHPEIPIPKRLQMAPFAVAKEALQYLSLAAQDDYKKKAVGLSKKDEKVVKVATLEVFVDYFNRPEFIFLKQLLEDPTVAAKLQTYPDKQAKLKVLLFESCLPNSTIVPNYFCLLKAQTVHSNTSCKPVTSSDPILYHFNHAGPFENRLPTEIYLPSNYLTAPYTLSDSGSTAIELHNKKKVNQSEIIANTKALEDLETTGISNQNIMDVNALIFCEAEDTLLRLFDDFKKNKHQFPDVKIERRLNTLNSLIFKPGQIEYLLEQSPHTAMMIAESINTCFHFFLFHHSFDTNAEREKMCLMLIEMATNIQRIALDLDKGHLFSSLNFLPYYEQFKDKNNARVVFNLLHDLHFPFLSEDEKQTFFIHLCQSKFLGQCFFHNMRLLSKWIDEICKLAFKNAQFRKRLAIEVFKSANHTLDSDTFLHWHMQDRNKLIFECQGLVINLLNREDKNNRLDVFKSADDVSTLDYLIINCTPSKFIYESDTVIRTPETSSGYFKINIIQNENGQKKHFLRWFTQNKVYYFVKINKTEQDALAKIGILVTGYYPSEECWIEETEGLFRQIIIKEVGFRHKDQTTYLLKRNASDSSYYLDSILVGGKNQISFPLAQAPAHSLHALKRFCKDTEIICTKDTTTDRLEIINFLPYGLSFQVLEKEAINEEKFPGFKIAENQLHASLKGITSYLLLDSAYHSKKKVLIPTGQFITSAAWRVTEPFGALNHALVEYGREIDQAVIHAQRHTLNQITTGFHVFNIDARGRLLSENPESMSYLLLLYIAQGDYEKAKEVCKELEKLLKRMPFSEVTEKQVNLLALAPSMAPELRFIRMRLYAALAESRLVHKTDASVQKSPGFEDYGLSLLSAGIIIIDLMKYLELPQDYRALTIAQEYFLFQTVFSVSEEAGKKAIEKIKNVRLKNLLKSNYADIFESLCLPPILQDRYCEIKRHYQMQESSLSSNFNIAKKLLIARSRYNPYYYLEKIQEKLPFIGLSRGFSAWHHILDMVRSFSFYISQPKVHFYNLLAPLDLSNISAEYVKKYFKYYYEIARGEKGKELKAEYCKIFARVKGGWDNESKLLVAILDRVAKSNHTFIFPHSSALNNQFEKLVKVVCFLEVMSTCSNILLKGIGQLLISISLVLAFSEVRKNFGRFQLLTMLFEILFYVVDLTRKHWTALIQKGKTFFREKLGLTTTLKLQDPRLGSMSIRFDAIKQDDQQIDLFLQDIFSQLFIEEEAPQAWHETPMKDGLEVPEHSDSALKYQINRINTSIDDYYARPDRVPNLLRFKGADALWKTYLLLEQYRDQLKNTLEHDKHNLIDCLNAENKSPTPITMDLLQNALLKENFEKIASDCRLSHDEMEKVKDITIRCTTRETRVQQLDRAIILLEEIMKLDENKEREKFENKLEDLANELQARRTYLQNAALPSRLFMRFLMIELRTNRMLWKSQIESIVSLLPKEMQNAVLELIMGLGKTTKIIPIKTSLEVDGTKAVFNNYPKQTAVNNIAQLSDDENDIFNLVVNGLLFSREIHLSKRDLSALSVVLQDSIKSGTNATTKEDAQSLDLITFEKMYYAHVHGYNEKSAEAIDTLRKILAIMRKGKAIIDEAHEIFDPNQELNYPLGSKSRIKFLFGQMIEKCMRFAMEDSRFHTLLIQNNLPRLEMKAYLNEITVSIAKKMLCLTTFEKPRLTDIQKDEFVRYVTGQLDFIPEWVKKHEQYPCIALIKGVLTKLLKESLSRLVGVSFDASKIHKDEQFAKPSNGNNDVKEDSCIRSPYEALVRTFIMLFCKGLNKTQCSYLISILRAKAQEEKKARGIGLKDTIIYQNMSKIVPDIAVFEVNKLTNDQLDVIEKTLGRNLEMIQLYIRYIITQQIPYWTLNLRSDAQNYGAQFESVFSGTGTPYNFGTYPSECVIKWTPGTTGEAIHIIKEKCPEDGIFVLKSDTPHENLNEILDRFFQTGSDYVAIIDGGALFKGLSNEEVVKKILQHASVHLPHIEAIKFYRKDNQGRDKLVWLEKGATDWSEIDEGRIPPEKCITYFDHPHGFAANILQKINGIGLETIGEHDDHILSRIIQDIFRMRGLKDIKRVFTEETNQAQTRQSIRFAMSATAQKKIFGDKPISWEGIVMYGIAKEAAKVTDNYKAQIQKIKNVIRSAVRDKIIFADSFKKAMDIFKEFIHVFVSKLEDDPVKLYAMIEKQVPYKQGLDACVEASWKHVADSSVFSPEEKSAIRQKLDNLANPDPNMMPELITAFTDGEQLSFENLDDHDKETQVNHYTEEASEIENENENETQTHHENQQQITSQKGRWKYPVHKWPENLNFLSQDWMKFTELARSILPFKRLNNPKNNELEFPIFKMRDLALHAASDAIREFASSIDERMWVTNNFIPRQVPIGYPPVEVGSKDQRHLIHALIHFEELPDGQFRIDRFGLIGIHDANQWRKYLRKMSPEDKEKKQKILLYDINLRGGSTGSHVDLIALRNDKNLQKLETLAKFLNGDVKYDDEQLEYIKQMIKDIGFEKVKDAFTRIYGERGVDEYANSDISMLFNSLHIAGWIDSIF